MNFKEEQTLEEYVNENGDIWKRMSSDCSITTGFITKIDYLDTKAGGTHYTFIMKVPVLMTFDENLENEVFYDDVVDFEEIYEFVSTSYIGIPKKQHKLMYEGSFVTVFHQSYALIPGKKTREGPQMTNVVKRFALRITKPTNIPEKYVFSFAGIKDPEERRRILENRWKTKFYFESKEES